MIPEFVTLAGKQLCLCKNEKSVFFTVIIAMKQLANRQKCPNKITSHEEQMHMALELPAINHVTSQ